MTESAVFISPESLETVVCRIFEGAGCSASSASDMAECLVQTYLWGIDSHGVLRVA